MLAEVERFWGAKSGTPKGDRIDILATLIDVYEAKQFPVDPPDPIAAIKFRMEQQGLTRKDVEAIFGTRNRDFRDTERVRQLHAKLGISAELLIRPSRLDKVA